MIFGLNKAPAPRFKSAILNDSSSGSTSTRNGSSNSVTNRAACSTEPEPMVTKSELCCRNWEYFSRNCAICSRQNSQPKCRIHTKTSVCCSHSEPSRTFVPLESANSIFENSTDICWSVFIYTFVHFGHFPFVSQQQNQRHANRDDQSQRQHTKLPAQFSQRDKRNCDCKVCHQ